MGRPSVATPRTPKTASRDKWASPGSRDKVLTGRIVKKSSSPAKLDQREDYDDKLDEDERELEADRFDEMMKEKELFPGSESWAEDELRLFQILFMRQFSPLLPSHWGIDFRGIPVPDILFATSRVDKPIIYSSSGNDFRATKSLIRLIDLTSTVRTFIQTNQRARIPGCIKKELDLYLRWTAQDGGFDDLEMIPNVVCDVIDAAMSGSDIAHHMQMRLRDLAQRHRDFWRKEKGHIKKEVDSDNSECGEGLEGDVEYKMPPPVLYGLFIVKSTLMVLTLDPAKGVNASASYQVDVNFNKRNQGVWNAITVGIVGCLARDDMIARKKYFGIITLDSEGDPDL